MISAAKEHKTLSPLQLLTDRILGEEVDGEKAKVAGVQTGPEECWEWLWWGGGARVPWSLR